MFDRQTEGTKFTSLWWYWEDAPKIGKKKSEGEK